MSGALEVVRCLVDRGRSQIRVDVPLHEVAVLRAVHGRNEVQVIERDVDEIALDAVNGLDPSAEAEWDRLERIYERTNEKGEAVRDQCRLAFPAGPVALEQFGFSSSIGPASRADEVRSFDERKEARKKAKARKAA